jgi:Lrp/AsnC family transcriptional regulator, leucine-responsive regulatory protein
MRQIRVQRALFCEIVTDPASLDDTDRQIIDLLREDARRTISDIAHAVNLSPAPVKRRIDRLEHLGVIAGYTVVLNQDRLGPSVDAFIELRMQGNASLDEITEAVTGIPEVREVFTVAGDPDALVRIRLENVAHLKSVVNALRLTGRVTGTKTLMVMDHWSRARAEAENAPARAARSVRVR